MYTQNIQLNHNSPFTAMQTRSSLGCILITLAATALVAIQPVHCARILGVFPHAGESHFIFFEPILKALDSAGHDVHIIAHFEVRNVSSRFQNILISNPGSSKNAVDLEVS